MLWNERIQSLRLSDAQGRASTVRVIAGNFAAPAGSARGLPPPPDSWASQNDADVAIWTIQMEAGARLTLPPAAHSATRRQLYFFRGKTLDIGGHTIKVQTATEVRTQQSLELINGDGACELLVLQGRPIGEPVAQHGPFVMNTQAEVAQAFADYRRTEFGGWPWPARDPVHPRERGRFARHANGHEEEAPLGSAA
jgi:redox-sensitive bicupin YhaK (pirin superfamily)